MATESSTRSGIAGARIADGIRSEIISGWYAPGDRIRQEEIAEKFGSSRIPVREAIRILEQEGLLTVKPNAGAWVARLTLAEYEEIYQIREQIEPLLLSYSAPHLLAEDLDRMQSLADRITKLGPEYQEFLTLDREFHELSYARAHTAQLGEFIHKLWNATAPYRRLYVESWHETAREITNMEHQLMVSLLREGDHEAASHVLAGHIRRTRRKLREYTHIFESTAE